MPDQQHIEDLMFSVLEVFCKKESLKLKSVWPLYFDDNKEYPLFKPAEVEDAVRSHAKNGLIYWDAADGNYDDKTYVITDRGKNVYAKEKIRRDKIKEESDLVSRKLKYDVKNAERVYKTYPSTRFMAIAACAASICLLLLKVIESLKIWPYNK